MRVCSIAYVIDSRIPSSQDRGRKKFLPALLWAKVEPFSLPSDFLSQGVAKRGGARGQDVGGTLGSFMTLSGRALR